MAQPRWVSGLSVIMVRMVPMGLLILVTVSMVVVVLLNTSVRISRNDFGRIFLRDQNMVDTIVPLAGSPASNFTNHNLTQYAMQNFTDLVWPIKAIIKYGIARGFIMIVNASTESEMNSIYVAASQHRASSSSWDINGALDGYMGELIAEVMEEAHVVEDAQHELVDAMAKCNRNDKSGHMQVDKSLSHDGLELTTSDWPYKLHWYGESLQSLVVFSSYRFSDTDFFVIVLIGTLPTETSPSKDPEADGCAWIHWQAKSADRLFERVGSPWHEKHMPVIQMGTKRVTLTNDLHRTTYDVAVIKCTFEDPAGANAKGGHLYIKKNNEFCPVFWEAPEKINTIQFEGEFKYNFAYCSPPIVWELNATHLKEWFMYHHFFFHVKKIHYFIYHGIDMNIKIMTVLHPLIKEGLVTLIDMRSPQSNLLGGQYPSYHLAMNDCLHRVRYLADWVFFWSFEEYLTISSHHTLSSILDAHKDDPWISLGSILWSNTYCCAQDERTGLHNGTMWIVDEMCFRMEYPICNDKNHATTCSGNEGQRKWIANPRLVFAASIHYALDPQWTGIALDTIEARLNVYRGLLNPNFKGDNCVFVKVTENFEDDLPLDGKWWKDLSMRNYTRVAHLYASSTKLFNSSFINPSPPWPLNVPIKDNIIHNIESQFS